MMENLDGLYMNSLIVKEYWGGFLQGHELQ